MPARAAVIAQHCSPYLTQRQRVLEIGAGRGLVAQALRDAAQVDITLVDVVDYNQTDLPLHLYDGSHLPFPDDSFDLSLLIFVLHHTPDPLPVLNEALRVSRSGVIVVENHVEGWLRRKVTRVIDSIPHWQYGVPVCYHTLTLKDWREKFEPLHVQTQLLARFSMDGGFWENFVMKLSKEEDGRQRIEN